MKKIDRLISSTSDEVNEISEKLDAIAEGQTCHEMSSDSPVNVITAKTKVNPVVVVKPKARQSSKKTMEEIKNTVPKIRLKFVIQKTSEVELLFAVKMTMKQ